MANLQHSHSDNSTSTGDKDLAELPLICRLIKEYTKVLEALNEHTAQMWETIKAMEDEDSQRIHQRGQWTVFITDNDIAISAYWPLSYAWFVL